MKMKFLVTIVLLQLSARLGPLGDVALEDNAVAENSPYRQGPSGFGDEGFNFDTSLFEAADQLDASTHTGNTIDHPSFASDETFVQSALPELQSTDFDIDKFLGEFDRIDCSKYNGDKADPLNVLCDDLLMNSAFGPLGDFNSDHYMFYNYLKSEVYQPLAYDINKRENLADLISDTVSLNQRNSLFYGQPLTSNYNKFQDSVLKIFEDIAGKTSDMEANKDVINELMISTLKRFHLYWNYLRYQNQFDKLKIDTKEIMKTILRTYMMKRDFLNYVSKTLIKGIIQAYYRFIRAHKMVEILNKYGPYLISAQIINRYKSFADRIQASNFNHVMAVKEISYLISLLQVYHILSYKQGIPDSTIQINFKTEIMLRIQREYENYVKLLPQTTQLQRVKQIKEYTAVLLLKFKHITFIMFQSHGIAQYANLPQMNYIKSSFAVKIYYEMLDNMLMLPKSCVNFLLLKSCVIHETTKNLRYITTKYNIKRSTYGWYFLQELSSMMKSLYSKANSQTWEQWNNFKTYYYSNLFSVMYTYKKLFQVADMDTVDDLETQLGTIIDNSKKLYSTKPLSYRLMDKLDKDMYNEFLSIKADYNNYAPIEKDPSILNFLRVRLHRFLDNFAKENNSQVNANFEDVIKAVKESLDKWVREVPGKPESVIAVSTLNTHPEFQQIDFNPVNQQALQVPSNDLSSSFAPANDNQYSEQLANPGQQGDVSNNMGASADSGISNLEPLNPPNLGTPGADIIPPPEDHQDENDLGTVAVDADGQLTPDIEQLQEAEAETGGDSEPPVVEDVPAAVEEAAVEEAAVEEPAPETSEVPEVTEEVPPEEPVTTNRMSRSLRMNNELARFRKQFRDRPSFKRKI